MLSSPAALRNRDPILDVLRRNLPAAGTVLEIASGSGEHVVHFAAALPALVFQPSDPNPEARASIAARLDQSGLANVRAPLAIDAAAPDWPVQSDIADALVAILCINMIHISPWSATLGLLDGAARLLPRGGLLYLYGPYRRDGVHTAPSNEAFDQDLRARDPQWGVRDLADIRQEAARRSLLLREAVGMPANNMSLLLRRE
jgi:SAM-dependent methyltransferase